MGRLCALAIVLGAVLVQSSPRLPVLESLYVASLCVAGLLALLCLLQRDDDKKQTNKIKRAGQMLRQPTVVLLVLFLSITWVTWRAEQRLSAVLGLEHENVVTRLTFRVTSLPNDTSESLRFEAQVLEQGKADKVLIFKKKRRQHYKRKNGHRQRFTALHHTLRRDTAQLATDAIEKVLEG